MSAVRHRWRAWVLSGLTMLVLLLSGCGGALPPLGADQERHQQRVDGLTITLDTLRDPQVNAAQPFGVALTDARGQPVDGADVYLDLAMDMLCLSGAKPIAEPVGPGRYRAQSVYQMPGTWDVTVVVERDERTDRATFVIPVADGKPWP